MQVARLLLILSLCSILLLAELPKDQALGSSSRNALASSQPENLKLLKVNMGARSVWSDGGYYIDEMVNGARSSGYDAVFFADNALQFGALGNLADPSFEDVNSTGHLAKWYTNVTGSKNEYSNAGPLTAIRPIQATNITQEVDYYRTLYRIRSGTHSLHLAIQSIANSSKYAGYAFVRDVFPDGYSFNQTSLAPSRPLLLNDITFSANVLMNSLGYTGLGAKDPLSFDDNGWFYVRFYFIVGAHRGPRSGMRLTVTIIYSDLKVDDFLRRIRSSLNQTDSKVVYRDKPPMNTWLSLHFNVTDLARTLFNDTVVENWRLGNFEIGTRSKNAGLVDVYVDDVSLEGSSSTNPLEYFKSSIQSRASNGDLGVYPGYSLDVTGQASLYAYGTTYLDLSRKVNLTDPTFWKTMTEEISSSGGIVVLGPVTSTAWRDYLVAVQAFGVPVIDGTTFIGLDTGRAVLNSGQPVAFAATRVTLLPSTYNSTGAWSVRVFAENNSEGAILDAIERGRAYLAIPNYTGTFETSAYGFPMGGNPVYIPTGENASLKISFSNLGPGFVRVYEGSRLALRQGHKGTETMIANLRMKSAPVSSLFVAVTTTNDSLALVGNPLKFVQTSMIPGGALFIDSEAWSVQSAQWTASKMEQRMQLVVNGPAGTNATVYLFSPEFRPGAKSPDKTAEFITVDQTNVDPASVYDAASSIFRITLRSSGKPIVIMLNFDIQQWAYWYVLLQSVGGLYILAALPLAILAVYSAFARFGKGRRTRRKEALDSAGS